MGGDGERLHSPAPYGHRCPQLTRPWLTPGTTASTTEHDSSELNDTNFISLGTLMEDRPMCSPFCPRMLSTYVHIPLINRSKAYT